MAVYTLFGQPSSPGTVVADLSSYTFGVQVSVSTVANLTAMWFYSAPTAAILPQSIALFNATTQAFIYSETASWSGAAGSGWVRAAFATPPSLAPGTAYMACVFQGTAGSLWYTATSHYWDTGSGSGGIASGPLSAPNNASSTGGQNAYGTNSSLLYPTQTFNSANYWVDTEITTSGPTPVSFSDNAGSNQSISIHASASPFDTAGAHDTFSVSIHVTFNDYAGSRSDFSIGGTSIIVKILVIASNALVTLNSSITMGVGAGTPSQFGMRQLASDRWNYMYPSN
jgi:hypothetical protein